jgi:hypothetical protein
MSHITNTFFLYNQPTNEEYHWYNISNHFTTAGIDMTSKWQPSISD